MNTALATLDPPEGGMTATIAAMGAAVSTTSDPAWLTNLHAYIGSFEIALKKRNAARDQQSAVAELKLRAERRLGEMLKAVVLDKGGRPPKNAAKTHNTMLSVRLSDLGITPMQSSRWQTEASVPEHEFVAWMDNMRARDEDITSAGLRRLAMELRASAGLKTGDEFPGVDTATAEHACPACGHVFGCAI